MTVYRSLRRVGSCVLAVSLALMSTVVTVAPAHATFATGGTGKYLSSIDWVDWGTDGTAITSTTTRTTTRTINGHLLNISCTVTPVSGSIKAYRSGDWKGDSFDDLYNVGGTGVANTLVAGIANVTNGATVSFTVACSAVYNGVPVPLAGLVVADAESTTVSGTDTEYLQMTPTPATSTWRILERERSAGCSTSELATVSTGNAMKLYADGQECSGLDGAWHGPAVVAFSDGATSAAVEIHGHGVEAAALGVVLSSDFSDAPASYGDAGAFLQPPWSGGVVANPSTGVNLFSAGFSLATPGIPKPAPRCPGER